MSAFDALVRPALVRIAAPGCGYDPHGDRYWGTGFFIAPGWVLTCAHVVAEGGSAVWRSEPAVGITWEDGKTTRETTGTVVLALPRPDRPDDPPDRWAFPDLALVRVPGAQKASCVRLSERPPVPPTAVGLHGWSRETGELGIRHVHGTLIGSDGKALVTDWVMPVEGCSGGPVVDHQQGAVVGLNKGRGRDGGAVVPVTALRALHDLPGGEAMGEAMRAHDRYHLARYRSLDDRPDWTRAQRLLPGAPGVSPGLRTHLHGHFAELPAPTAPGEIMDLIDQVKAWIRDDELPDALEDDPRTWSEGAGLLRGLRAPRRDGVRDLDLDAVLLYAAHVARHVRGRYGERADTAGLTRWIVDESGDADRHLRREIDRLVGPGRPAPLSVREPRARADVLLEIDTPRWDRRYPWRVKLLLDGHTVSPLHFDDRGVERTRLKETLREPLADALRRGDSGPHLAAVEAVLPRELFDEPLDTWRLEPPQGPDDAWATTLGQRRFVVIRDARRHDREPAPEWRERWEAAEQGPLRVAPLRAEVPGAGPDAHTARVRRETWAEAYDRLREAEGGTVPVYCGHVGSGDGLMAMNAALAAGHPLALWRTGAHDHTDCAEFHERADRLLSAALTAWDVRGPLRSLRTRATDRAAGPEARAAYAWAESIAVLLDAPDRPPHGGRLEAPPLIGEGEE
ncbi:trypsin-like peptidase domain-containing protein [Streptomyces sp. NBC_00572]|uniref:VMAP-C domain-containing protein n=1 Tax=Streptomyces sp. NBC_00572 TaxID=2903664 RepID=UPI00225A0E07|nr:trypsin-like peptidase domain-containing protein [Streptomyces sp. NBC_00572]MCX4983420.1 trypsin-like peptidase domain-containing protein [Streptomyces sp. NBC_00572]